MKIRIKGNSIRYRLVKSEVKQLAETNLVEEYTEFSNSTLIYRLMAKEDIHELEADFKENMITMYIPIEDAKSWYDSNQITFKNKFEKISLLVEKDFVCLDHSEEDQSDNYENPNKTC